MNNLYHLNIIEYLTLINNPVMIQGLENTIKLCSNEKEKYGLKASIKLREKELKRLRKKIGRRETLFIYGTL